MEKAYLIDLTKTRVVGAFDSLEDAEAKGRRSRFDFTVVTDAGDIESQLKRDEMVKIYNQAAGAELVKFSNKVEGAKRTFEALSSMAPAEPKAEPTKPSANKKPRKNGAVAQVWAIADALHAKGAASRAAVLAQAEEQGVNLNTAKTQWQHWRKANL